SSWAFPTPRRPLVICDGRHPRRPPIRRSVMLTSMDLCVRRPGRWTSFRCRRTACASLSLFFIFFSFLFLFLLFLPLLLLLILPSFSFFSFSSSSSFFLFLFLFLL